MATGTIKNSNWKLLWTNPSPSAAFAGQTVPLDLSRYSEFCINYKGWKDDSSPTRQQIIVGFYSINATQFSTALSSGQGYIYGRTMQTTENGVVFGDAASKTAINGNSTADNGWAVPYQIYAR